VLADCVLQNLLTVQMSTLIPDMAKVSETMQTELESSVRAFLEADTHLLIPVRPATSGGYRGRKKTI
jgi:hypothetical protein